ncbi:hypothetical protein ACFLS9_01405 [Bacteroidota bacterium]
MKFISISLIILLFTGNSIAQDSLSHRTVYPEGISVEYGLGNYSVRDEYISKEKYSGTLPFFNINWSQFHNKYGYYLELEYRNSSEIKNYNISTDIYQFSLNQGFLYPLPRMSLFGKDVYVFLGPSTELYFFYNKQNIAVAGFDYAQSFAALISVGVNSKIIYPIRKNLQVEGSLDFSMLSLGFRMVDDEEEDISPVKLLTLLSGMNGSVNLGMRYNLFSNFSLKLAYKLHVTRISSWDPLLSASDNLIIAMAYKF